MRIWETRKIVWLVILVLLLGCSSPTLPTKIPADTAPTTAAVEAGSSAEPLTVRLYYPTEDTEVETGQPLKFTAQVFDSQDQPLDDAQVTITVQDPNGENIATIPAAANGGVYRSEPWHLPNGIKEGIWRYEVAAKAGPAHGSGSASFPVRYSTMDILLHKYGVWIDPPTLGGISPTLYAERGDAQNGMFGLGGVLPGLHILQANWLEVQWRPGDFKLDKPEAVRQYLFEEIGILGFTPVRQIDPFEPYRFKDWDAWKADSRGQFNEDQIQWLVFYAPEVEKTFVIYTMLVLPPASVSDPHAHLRESFAVFSEIQAEGVAPVPQPQLLPVPQLLNPPMAARFSGPEEQILLEWQPVKELAEDEYYQVVVDYYFQEDNPKVKFNTRETQLVLPVDLYHTPNCRVFNWQVTLMRQTTTQVDGRVTGEASSYPSLYWYLRWLGPDGESRSLGYCPYTHKD